MGYCIGFILLLWVATKATPKKKEEYIDTIEDDVIYVTSDELDEVLVRLDELEERLKEVETLG